MTILGVLLRVVNGWLTQEARRQGIAAGDQSNSRLSCQSNLGSEDVEVEITRESRQAYLDEHADERTATQAAAS